MLILLGAGLFVLGVLWLVGRSPVGHHDPLRGLRVLQVTLLVADVVLLVSWLSLGQGASIQPVRSVDSLGSGLWVLLGGRRPCSCSSPTEPARGR